MSLKTLYRKRTVIWPFTFTQLYGLYHLEKEDFEFIKNFVVNSGSLKALAKYYEVSYPTVRNRLNSVIERIESAKDNEESSLVNYVKSWLSRKN